MGVAGTPLGWVLGVLAASRGAPAAILCILTDEHFCAYLGVMVRPHALYPTTGTGCRHADCNQPAWLSCPKGLCLFHSPYNGRLEATARTVWHVARFQAKHRYSGADFTGWHFPIDPDMDETALLAGVENAKGGFVGVVFHGVVRFESAHFKGSAFFKKACFPRGVDFHNVRFERMAFFERAVFNRGAGFVNTRFGGGARFDNARFGRRVTFWHADFREKAVFKEARFGAEVYFPNAKFAEAAYFGGTHFGAEADFCNVSFARDCSITFDPPRRVVGLRGPRDWRPRCWAVSLLARSILRDAGSCLEAMGRGDHETAERVLRAGARWPGFVVWQRRPFRPRYRGELAYRLAKQAAHENGDYTEAGRYHYAEQCAIEDGRRARAKHRPWPLALWLARLVFGRIIFGYGERPWYPFLVGLAVILVGTGLYLSMQAIAPGTLPDADVEAYAETDFWQALHFSVVTFTTLGYGDLKPKPGYRWIADLEAVLGAALMATFVVCLTRKYMR